VAAPLLAARGLVVAHPGRAADEPTACGPVDLTLEAGGFLTITGGNGRGKTALLATLAGLVAPVAGSVSIGGRDPFAAATRRAARLDVGVVFQEPETQHLTDAVEREIAFPLENLGWPRADIVARVDEVIASLGLEAVRGAAPAHLSGGEAQRLALAAALAPRPRVLLLDEPASYLDVPGRAALVEALERLRAAGTAVVWSACARDESPAPGPGLDLGGGAAPLGATASPAIPGRTPAPGAGGPLLWEGRGLALTRQDERGSTRLWRGLELRIAAGDRVVLLGDNGAGKTALLDLLAGLVSTRPGGGFEGSLSTCGQARGDRPRLRYLTQYPESQLFAATVGEDVSFGARGGRSDRRARAAAALTAVGLDPAATLDRAPEALSIGERRRVALAGALLGDPEVLLLDEPTAGLDLSGRFALDQALEAWIRGGDAGAGPARSRTIVLASHDAPLGNRPGWRTVRLPAPERSAPEGGERQGSRP
jgi:energy-coupling factor transport system ATP-binding protein